MNQRLAKEVEEADARPERGIGDAGPEVGFENPQQRFDETVPGIGPAERAPTPTEERDGARGSRKSPGPRGLMGASSSNEAVAERTPIDDWIDGEDMDFENGDQVQQSLEVPPL